MVSPWDTRSPTLILMRADGARRRRRDLHRRLVGFQRHQRVFGADLVAFLHQDLDDRHVLEVADVGNLDLDRVIGSRRRAVARLAIAGRGGGVLPQPFLGRDRGPALGFQQDDQVAFRDLVAGLHLDLADRAGLRARHLQRRLVGLQRQQRVFHRHLVAGLHVDLDDRHVLEVADIGNADFDHAHGQLSSVSGDGTGGHRTSRRTSSSTWQRCREKRAASAPSITRWS